MDTEFSLLRTKMVEEQIVSRGVSHPATLQSMLQVPRHLFVPENIRIHAYDDSPLPIGEGQTISQPYIVALMTQAAELNPLCVVLEIGTGSGYAAAVLSRMVEHVYTIERISPLSLNASKRFEEQRYTNISTKIGDGTLGWSEKGPFDAIIVTAGAPLMPESLAAQLKLGGRIIIPVGNEWGQELIRFRKLENNEFQKEFLEYVRFVPLIGKQGWREK
jgi:protein-L-isoaspartate(D-aspartate) O-methyltransferase